jgi:sigma-E factor negative regulatory protein RseB
MDGSVKMVSQVWHNGGGSTLVETSSDTTPAAAPVRADAGSVANSDPVSGSPEGVFGVTKGLVAQLGKHYIAVYWGSGSVVGRPTSVVELYRVNGSVAARYWLDSRTLVPLRRELFGTSHNVISEDSFVHIRFGAFTPPRRASAAASPSRSAGQAQPSSWVTAPSPARFLTALTRKGWQVPAVLPGGLPLYAAASTNTSSGEIVALEYTDGLYVVSLFMQRGTLTPDMAGWRRVNVAGKQAFVSGHSVTWAEPGFVYTVIADAPPQTVTQLVQTMPGGTPGVFGRLGRGFVRLAQVINPFG